MFLQPQLLPYVGAGYATENKRILHRGAQKARNGAEDRSSIKDLNIALTMAQMPVKGVPARKPSAWPAEAWIVDGDQALALLVATFQQMPSTSDTTLWPQIASIVFPDRHLGAAQLRWIAAEKAAQLMAKALYSGCRQTAATLDLHPPPFLILYHLLRQMRGQKALQAYKGACIISSKDAAHPWSGGEETAVCAVFPVFSSGQIYGLLWDTDTNIRKWADQHGGFNLSSYLCRPRLPERASGGTYIFGHAGYQSSSGYTTSSGEVSDAQMSDTSDESLGADDIRRDMETCHI